MGGWGAGVREQGRRARIHAGRPPSRLFPGCYTAVERGVKVDALLRRWGLMSPPRQAGEPAEPGAGGWLARALSGAGSSLALAFVANKALFPLRAPVTLALTPAVARALRARAAGAAERAADGAGRRAGRPPPP